MKPPLPVKTCAVCQRPFTWRKKWERDWENVKYCSKRCAAQGRHTQSASAAPAPPTPRSRR